MYVVYVLLQVRVTTPSSSTATPHRSGRRLSQPTTAELVLQHAAPTQPDFFSVAAPPDAGEPVVSSPASLPIEILGPALRGELQKVVKWLRNGGLVDALYS